MAPRKIIIDTDPGVDDILAMLLAFSALPKELEILLISVTYGNVDLQNCLRNVISVFYHIEREIAWRKSVGREPGFETLRKSKPLVAVGPEHPLDDEMLMADFFHGRDGLGGIHESHPHLTPADTWKQMFSSAEGSNGPAQDIVAEEMKKTETIFTPSRTPAHQEILTLLRENDPDSITIVAIGPLTNLAMAAAEDPETFLRVKEVVVMGGSIKGAGNVRSSPPSLAQPGTATKEPPFRLIKQPPSPIRNMLNQRNQITPTAEFNTYADSYAAARVYALTSPRPRTTMPPVPPAPPGQPEGEGTPPHLEPYPGKLSRRLKVTLFPLDITEKHVMTRGDFHAVIDPQIAAHSPLAEWAAVFMASTFGKVGSLHPEITGDAVGLSLHDPLCVWYCMIRDDPKWDVIEGEDIRVETSGQWTRGMNVVDRRSRRRRDDGDDSEVPGDTDGWLTGGSGNRLRRAVASPGEPDDFGRVLLKRVFLS
ncbi:hypothetical protein LTR37_013934 [Vermiconidia calcicola]|uniref:Uncharacterized protein n=1 Tax=Vermiconidia calcicola TaxID=1690605 RepID=A0ACC3MUY5_9PEZI|nr:hypothetical protein LTR37_013934 [Vermiconidia calcicola]